ncbi:MAG: hypothetical protein KZQ78_09745, partial [Candidatus Thiodiazotropha sp. (ex Ustalcina ferruginea)]|nr:hypothetical protein [Candidatus Thiodiazotropha sp. (ex Ustalcina ferruginea)]
PLRDNGYLPGPYAYRGLPACAFAIHGRQRKRAATFADGPARDVTDACLYLGVRSTISLPLSTE